VAIHVRLQVVGDGDMLIRNLDVRWLGKTHDSRVWKASVAKTVIESQSEFAVVGDSGARFTKCKESIILT
jgi:hypothetical protein